MPIPAISSRPSTTSAHRSLRANRMSDPYPNGPPTSLIGVPSMTRTLRSRSPLLAAAVAAVAIPLAGAGAASGAEVQVHGPTNPKVDKNFTVRATGKTGKERVLQVTIHLRGKCRKTYGDEKDSN